MKNAEKNKPLTFFWPSPVGLLGLTAEGQALTGISFSPTAPAGTAGATEPGRIFQRACRQLEEYFAGRRRNFHLPLAPAGTKFQRQVWAALRDIPYGQTVRYGVLAARAGFPRAFRAVGQACRRNPLALLIPCHRVVGWNGRLTGFAGGLSIKDFLLKLEAGNAGR
jgi:methylated-DNA-[protein]-cysteine S-methyltransferase